MKEGRNMPDDCPACEGRGLVRLRWNDRVRRQVLTAVHEWTTAERYRDEWCRRCNGKGVIQQRAAGKER